MVCGNATLLERKEMAKTTKKKKTNVKAKKKRGPKRKKVSRRRAAKNPGLDKRFFSRIKQEYFDIDYLDKLSEKDKVWLGKFMEEDLGANFSHPGKKLYKKKDRKLSYGRNNARNRDIYSQAKAQGKIMDLTPETALDLWQDKYINYNTEDDLIDKIDQSKQLTEDLLPIEGEKKSADDASNK